MVFYKGFYPVILKNASDSHSNSSAMEATQMKPYSIFNNVLGPIMHGPSSSHTAASFRIGVLARDLLGEPPAKATFTFDKSGSYARVFRDQGSDLGFASGMMGWPITDDRFLSALDIAADEGVDISFRVDVIKGAIHPNTVHISLLSTHEKKFEVLARSVGGGSVEIAEINGRPILITGEAHDYFITTDRSNENRITEMLGEEVDFIRRPKKQYINDLVMIHGARRKPLADDILRQIEGVKGFIEVLSASPILFIPANKPSFTSAAEMLKAAGEKGRSLGEMAVAYEADLLGLPEDEIKAEMRRRLEVMLHSVRQGLEHVEDLAGMQLLSPTAHKVFEAEKQGKLGYGGAFTKAAARAMAVMHVNGGMGLVCAAPTGGSCGVLPGVLTTLMEDYNVNEEDILMSLFAASAVGLIILMRGDTFAAEVAGCQVEIGAAGAMAAAAAVEAAGGTAGQACDAAAIALQNTMGSPCDLIQGVVEVPCHTRNAAAAASAFVCADLIMGGYYNPVGLDETVDASLQVGRALPPELRCTALGGLAITPSALSMSRKSRDGD